MINLKLGSKIKLRSEDITVEVDGIYGETVHYKGENGERGILVVDKLNEDQIINYTILDEIKKDYNGFNIVVKSKESQDMVNSKFYKKVKGSTGEWIYLTGLSTNKYKKVLYIQIFKNNNCRVITGKYYK